MESTLAIIVMCILSTQAAVRKEKIPSILAWTQIYESPTLHEWFEKKLRGEKCSKQCNIIPRSEMTKETDYDAIIFHSRDLNVSDLPNSRRQDQYYLLFTYEAPGNRAERDFAKLPPNFFNGTIGYSHLNNYIYDYDFPVSNELKMTADLLRSKNNSVLGVISNCQSESGREEVIKRFRPYLKMTLRGHCYRGSRVSDAELKQLIESHRFIFALENKICEEYVTEKAFRYKELIVPIVLSRRIAEEIIPSDAFIAIDDFDSIAELAEYLNRLQNDDAEYMKYFSWLGRRENREVKRRGICHLCSDLHSPPFDHFSLSRAAFPDEKMCTSPSEFLEGIVRRKKKKEEKRIANEESRTAIDVSLLAIALITTFLALVFVSLQDHEFPPSMLTASLLAIALIAAFLALASELCDEEQSGSPNLNDDDEIIRRETSGSEEKVDVIELSCNSAFQSLTANQQKYAHYATKAFFEATLPVYFQISPEAAGVFIMLYRLFSTESMEQLREIADACDFTENEWNNLIVWSALRLSCYANNFTGSKVPAPRVDEMKFKNLIASSEGASEFPGTRLYYAPIFVDIYEPYVFPRPKTFSDNIQEFVKNAYRKFYNSLETAELGHDSRIRFALLDFFHPLGEPEYYQGFVGICNEERNKIYSRLTNNVKRILKKLSWGKDYETDTVANAKLTAFELIAFTFKGGVLGGQFSSMDDCRIYRNLLMSESNKLIHKEEDLKLIGEYRRRGREVHTALHELFGHGSGKLFTKSADGVFNFDKNKTVDILTGGRVTSWYEPGETYESVFGDMASAFEECKADAVGYVLSCDTEVLKLFGYTGDSAENITYTNSLWMADMGLNGLMNYNVEKNNFGKCAYSWARFVLLKVFLEAGEGYLTIEQTKDSNGDGLFIHLDRTKIDSVGVPAVREFLKKLQALKSTADVKGARALFDRYSVGPTEVKWRSILICIKRERIPIVILQPNTVMNADGSVELKRYPVSAEGVIQSVIERYPIETIDKFEKLWRVEMDKSPLVVYTKEIFPNDTAETRSADEPIID